MWRTALWIAPTWELLSSSKMLSAFCSRSWRFGTGGENSFCWTTWCYVDGKHNIMADLQASVGWRRGINNAPCRHWPPVLILLVDLGERSPLQLTLGAEWSLIIAKLPHHCGDSPLVWKLGIKSNLLLLSREVVYSVHYWKKCLLTREVEMHEYTCAVVSVLILCFFLVLRIFWEEQLAEQFWYFNFSLYLVVFWAEQ